MGAYVNVGAFYLVGVPVALTLAFLVHLKGKGLWIGTLTGSDVQATLHVKFCVDTVAGEQGKRKDDWWVGFMSTIDNRINLRIHQEME